MNSFSALLLNEWWTTVLGRLQMEPSIFVISLTSGYFGLAIKTGSRVSVAPAALHGSSVSIFYAIF
jgi:hypothetical protein